MALNEVPNVGRGTEQTASDGNLLVAMGITALLNSASGDFQVQERLSIISKKHESCHVRVEERADGR